MRGAYTRGGLVAGSHTSDQVARRAAALEQVRALLAERPMSCFDLSSRLGIPSNTVYGYLSHLRDMGEVYPMDSTDDRGRKIWARDNEAQQAANDRAAAEHARRAWIVPARQIGIQRHWMDVALFGPARDVAA